MVTDKFEVRHKDLRRMREKEFAKESKQNPCTTFEGVSFCYSLDAVPSLFAQLLVIS
jgi:hypothetical protein